jgi:hypothetical protein
MRWLSRVKYRVLQSKRGYCFRDKAACDVQKGGRASLDAHLSDDKAVAKMGHPSTQGVRKKEDGVR